MTNDFPEEIGYPPTVPQRLQALLPAIIQAHQEIIAKGNLDQEQGGLLIQGENYNLDPSDIKFVYFPNKALATDKVYFLQSHDYFKYMNAGTILAFIHTHPLGQSVEPSEQDVGQAHYCDADWVILSSSTNQACYLECGYYGNDTISRVVKAPYFFSTYEMASP